MSGPPGGIGRILAPTPDPNLTGQELAPITENALVQQARSATRALATVPSHQHFYDTLSSFGGALEDYSAALGAGISRLREERLNPEKFDLIPDQPMEITTTPQAKVKATSEPTRQASKEVPRAPTQRTIPSGPEVKAGLKNNPGKLLGQLLSLREPEAQQAAPPPEIKENQHAQRQAAPIIQALQNLGQPQASPTPPPAPVPKVIPVEEPASAPLAATPITDVATPDAAPTSRFVIRRRSDGKIMGMSTPDGDYDLERDSNDRVSAINLRKRG